MTGVDRGRAPSGTGGSRNSTWRGRLAAVGPLAVVLVAVVTIAGVQLGPAPHGPDDSNDISEVRKVLIEPSDRLVYAGWLLVALLLSLAVLYLPVRRRLSRRISTAAASAVAASAVVIATLAILLDVDEVHLRAPVDAADVVVGIAFTAIVVASWTLRRRSRRLLTFTLTTVLLLLVVPELWQTLSSVRDWDSFRFVADEIAAPAAGRVPYGNFAPQYSAVLGIPVAPLLSALPSKALSSVLVWLIALQCISLVLAVALPVLSGGRRYVLSTALLVFPPVAAMSAAGLSATSYYAGIPLRVVLPLATIVAAFLVLRRPQQRYGRLAIVGLGIASGATALNNPDFGLPAAVAVTAAALLVDSLDWRVPAETALFLAAGGAVSVMAFAAWTWVAGAPISMSYLLVFQRIFGVTGYFNVAMPAFGMHIFVVALFLTAAVVGVVLRWRAPSGTWLGQQGLTLTLVGVWSLLSLGYYVGRSYTATLIGGFALQVGLAVACLVPIVAASARLLVGQSIRRVPLLAGSVVLGLLAIGWCTSNIARLYPPTAYIGMDYERAATGLERLDEQVVALRRGPVPSGTTQLLEMPSITAIMSGVGTETVVNNPGYLVLSRNLATLQCREIGAGSADHVIATRAVADGLERSPECQEVLDLAGATAFARPSDLVSIRIRR